MTRITQLSDGSSFGYHSAGSVDSNTDSIAKQKKLIKVLDIARKVNLTFLVILGICTAAGVAALPPVFIALASFGAISALYYGSSYYNYHQICQTAGIVFKNSEEVKRFEVAGIKGSCEALPTEHCADTEVWREDLIKAAEHNIVISGNYCGGTSFANFLKLVEKRMEEKPALKVVILSSPNFIKNGNLAKIESLQKKYADRFSLVESPDIWHVSQGLKKSTNHTKCMVIDYGKYFILGGSGIKDNFAQTGLDNLSKADFLKQKKMEKEGVSSLPESVTDAKPAEEVDPNAEDGFLGKLIPGNFRDMDFVFKSKDGRQSAGAQVYKQMLLLCHRWEQYNAMLNKEVAGPSLDVNKLGVFTQKATEILPEDSVVVRLLKTPMPLKTKTKVTAFDSSSKKSAKVAFQIFASGPEHDSSQFAKLLEQKIKKAKNQIVINHMYFQPTSAIMKALVQAAKRGVKVKIITSCVYADCPSSHLVFGPRNKYNYAHLVNKLSPEERANVEVYEYQQKKKGNHKKVIIVDDMVIAGSSNLGYKSLVSTSDHELNFFAKSQAFADQTYEVCKIDMQHSKKIEGQISLKVHDYVQAALHRLMAPLIG